MDPFVALLLGLLLGMAVGGVCGVFVARARQAGNDAAATAAAELRRVQEVTTARESAAAEAARIGAELAAVLATAEGLRDQVTAQQDQYRELVATQARERSEREQRARAENSVLQALAPVRESLQAMQKQVTDLELQRTQQHGELSQQLRTATDAEERLRLTAESLASALRNNSIRGVWGETQLRSVVEAAGLIERVDFDVQSSINSEAGGGRPDMVVHLPGGKNIAVDAKVPFSAYIDANAIPATASDAELARRTALLKQHVKAVRDHVSALGSRGYWDGLDASPELVIAFIPSESLISSALEVDPGIMEFAFGKRVALASPVTLWSVLKTVAFSWQQEVVTREAKELFSASRELYSRLSTLASHVDKLGRSIERSVKDYNTFVGSLERQIYPSARRLSLFDESKVIGEPTGIEEAPRELTRPELTEALDSDES